MELRAPDVMDAILVLLRSMKIESITTEAMNRLLSVVEIITEDAGDVWRGSRDNFSNNLFSAMRKYGASTSSLKEHFHYFSKLEPPDQQGLSSSIFISSSFNDSLEPHRKLFFAPSYQEFLQCISKQQ
ncbi:Hypothetical protein GLP15_1018 [Giardia lamblia P15]|uniref:Uncharacterized protein n=1 Tax=Giardia intestinalis (strain P15) TaxID=658858 RepID=E1F316_GIAIA|nr:Hypothetical protein GLP15_1018 [Giardia lamblia P15]